MILRHRMVRAVLAIALLFGLGASAFEGLGCDERFEVQSASMVAPEWTPAGPPAVPGLPCCPCIHTYPSNITLAVISAAFEAGYTSEYRFIASNRPDRLPEPLVPPPIA